MHTQLISHPDGLTPDAHSCRVIHLLFSQSFQVYSKFTIWLRSNTLNYSVTTCYDHTFHMSCMLFFREWSRHNTCKSRHITSYFFLIKGLNTSQHFLNVISENWTYDLSIKRWDSCHFPKSTYGSARTLYNMCRDGAIPCHGVFGSGMTFYIDPCESRAQC